jgi:Mrp family chromosome partitioning ATPase
MSQMTGEFPRAISRPAWLTARARNAVNRPLFIGAVGLGAIAAVVVGLVLAPQQVRRVGHMPSAAPPVGARPDTAPFIAALSQARTRLGTAEASLVAARSRAAVAAPPPADTISPKIAARRDSLAAAVNDLDALLTRVETAPVSASYRALGESPQLTTSARVKTLLDSLTEVERDRDAFGGTGVADPTYVALTSRATEIGREIQMAAQARRDSLRDQVSRLVSAVPQQAVAQSPAADTAAWLAERDSAQSLVTEANAALSQAREKAKQYDQQVVASKEEARLDAPIVALLSAALVFGIALGFGVAFFSEVRHPRVSDEHELERVLGTRVLASIRPKPRSPDRRRRSTDRDAPPYFDPGADGYQLTYLHVARAGASRLMLTVAGDDTSIAAVIATNVAAIAADEARSTIIIDTDSRATPVAAALRIHAEPGIADVVGRRTDWAEVTSQASVGRDRVIDVIPSGVTQTPADPRVITSVFRDEAPRLARHYEAIIIVATTAQVNAGLPSAVPIPDTILCARIGHTRIDDLRAALESARAAGANPLGIVLWNAPPPALPSPSRVARAPRPLRTPEMQALTVK